MKLNIIDCRNQYLGFKLFQLDNNAPIISLKLSAEQKLSDDMKSALQLYVSEADSTQIEIDITVEVNRYVNKAQAINILKTLSSGIKQFFKETRFVQQMPSCNLNIFKDNQFLPVMVDEGDA